MDYLPKLASIGESCEWLREKTGTNWSLPRLLECHLVPHFWLDSTPETAPIFEGRAEGFLMRMLFAPDAQRLEAIQDDALVQIAATPDGRLVRFSPPLRVALNELRFKREDVVETAELLNKGSAPSAVQQATPPAIDFAMLATREQLITAFGRFTGMGADWFDNLKDAPALRSARKVAGQGGRGHIAEPLFCPFEVMQWLVDPKRRKGSRLSPSKGWELLEKHFPSAYAKHSIGDPREPD